MVSAEQALKRLIEGNGRFVEALNGAGEMNSSIQKEVLNKDQTPFAIILGCSDSRVPAEIVFDQGLGDLFVIRVAGNIVAPSQIGSIEFAAEQFGTALVVVLGHTNCGAVKATLNELQRPSQERSENLHAIVRRIRPAVERVLEAEHDHHDHHGLTCKATRANVRASVENLSVGSGILDRLVAEGKLKIVGAEFSLETGEVEFFAGMEQFQTTKSEAPEVIEAEA